MGRFDGSRDWLFVRDGEFYCQRCGTIQEVKLPAPTNALLLEMEAFEVRHADCRYEIRISGDVGVDVEDLKRAVDS